MKIAKSGVTAAAKPNTNSNGTYDECIGHIRSAINSLGTIAKTDDKAKEAIANLSVILFDLQP